MTGSVRVITPPALEPVSLEDMKLHLRVDHSDEDTLIAALGVAARMWVESYTGRTLFDTTLEAAWTEYPACGTLEIPQPPIIAIASFSYTDSSGAAQVIAADQYVLDISNPIRPLLLPAYGVSWPATRCQPSSVLVRYRAGYAQYGSPDERGLIPEILRSAIKLHAEAHYDRDERSMMMLLRSAEALCDPYRVHVGIG